MEQACTLEDDAPLSDDAQLERWTSRTVDILMTQAEIKLDTGKGNRVGDDGFNEIEMSFHACNEKLIRLEKDKEFEIVEDFVLMEKRKGRKRREKARLTQAAQEIRMAAEIAALAEFRNKSKSMESHQGLQNKISDAERAYANRVKVHAKAGQVASSECRAQFTRVRAFFEELHQARLASLNRQRRRNLQLQALNHRLRRTDARVIALEQQTAIRIFHKKKTDLNELHMAQHLEESVYLDKMMDLLDGVQVAKEKAAEDIFQLQLEDLKKQRENNDRRNRELEALNAECKIQMAKLVAHYVKDDDKNNEDEEEVKEGVESTERRKNFNASTSNVIISVSQLYDTVLWSVALNQIGMSSSAGSSLYSSELDSEEDEDDDNRDLVENTDDLSTTEMYPDGKNVDTAETASTHSVSTANTTVIDEGSQLESAVGIMHVRQINKEIRKKRKALTKQHDEESKQERRLYRHNSRVLRKKHQQHIDNLLAQCVVKRHELRDAISQRMAALEKSQLVSTKSLREDVMKDVKAMQDAWAEHKRLEEAEKSSFAKAQALISAQVFHEVRNALSSVISMSEITSSLQQDTTISPKGLMSSVDEMLDQIKEVVHYALNMLNNILDVSKMNSGTFDVDRKLFDLQDLVSRATKMQLVKAKSRKVNMSYQASADPLIAYTDNDIVVRIVTNFISNAVKFTACGSVQPFVWPVESVLLQHEIIGHDGDEKDSSSLQELVEDLNSWKSASNGNSSSEKAKDVSECPHNFQVSNAKMRMVLVGVADTGPGLKKSLLEMAEDGLSNSDTKAGLTNGAKNTGFGLHLAHQLAKALDTKVYLLSLSQCESLLDQNTKDAMIQYQRREELMQTMEKIPGRGTILGIMLPVFVDGLKAREALERNVSENVSSLLPSSTTKTNITERYVFKPMPAPGAATFRILVADDVFMLRKGLVHTLIAVFSRYTNCPITINSACTAEDVLRAVDSATYDLLICDNQFADPSELRSLGNGEASRPCVYYREEGSSMTKTDPVGTTVVPKRKVISKFFSEERFTIEEGDGSLSGLNALIKIGNMANDPTKQVPVLILLSGHKIQFPPQENYAIIVVQKPLKQPELVPLLEAHAHSLVNVGHCREAKDTGEKDVIFSKSGSRLFVKEVVVTDVDMTD